MGRKNYASLDDLIDDLDHESILDEGYEPLEDEDLELLAGPQPLPKPPRRKAPPQKRGPKPRKK